MTAAEIISEAKSVTRQGVGIPDATFLTWLNRINRNYCRKDEWPQMRVLNAALTTEGITYGTYVSPSGDVYVQPDGVSSYSAGSTAIAAYDLPADFDRLSGDRVTYGSTATYGVQGYGCSIPVMSTGAVGLDNYLGSWSNNGTAGYPAVAYLRTKPDTSGVTQIVFAPVPTATGQTVVYSYYRNPDALESGSTIPIPSLGDAYTMALAREIDANLNQMEKVAYWAQMERRAYANAKANLLRQ